jgi:S1-C subfamily serine protease
MVRFVRSWVCLWLAWCPAVLAAADVRESVVKIFADQRAPDLARPWSKQNAQEVSGSGVVIEGNRILTNAHVVQYANQIFVQPYSTSDKLPATVEAIAHGMDLAVLKLSDESFYKDHPPLAMADELPEVRDTASAYGYPFGGSELAITKGIVSRIEWADYFAGEAGLRIQVDTAINPGNSGGPVLVDDKMIGVAFSVFSTGQNIGYIIPNEEIKTFLADIADGRYDSKLRLYWGGQGLENDALRAKFNLEKATTGVLITDPVLKDPAYPLKKWDILSKVGTYAVDNAGIVQVKPNLRLRFDYVVAKAAQGDKLKVTVLREGKPLELDVPLVRERKLVLRFLKGAYPSFFIYGPLVFSAATQEYAAGIAPVSAALTVRGSPLTTRRLDETRFAGEELVVIAGRALPHRITRGYNISGGMVLESVNGVAIKNLRHLVETLHDLKDKQVELQFVEKGAEVLVFNREEIAAATEEILSDNGIRQPYSADLREAWEKK